MSTSSRLRRVLPFVVLVTLAVPTAASATPVCTDGYMGGPSRSECGGRVFPEAAESVEYVQYSPDPVTGFAEYQHGIEYLEQLYPRWISVFTLNERFGTDEAVGVGPDGVRSYEDGDAGDGGEIFVIKVTDHEVPDEGKQTLLFSLSIHGDEKGGIEGGLRVIEDLGIEAEAGDATIADGVEGYESTTGVEPVVNSYPVRDLLAKEAVYFVAFNVDGWRAGDHTNTDPAVPPLLYTRGNALGTDLNRQMPTVGRINPSRNPLQEAEAFWSHKLMHEVAAEGVGGLMAYGADVHGETQSRAFADIMYPAGQFDSVKHRQLMAIAERTKSVIDATLYDGLIDFLEEMTGGDAGEGIEDYGVPIPNTVPTKPARWGTVWDTLGYTDTGFIGDYMASELGVTGMDYEIALNHADYRAVGRPWTVLLQENYINATRAIVKTAMAYALYQEEEFADFTIDPVGTVGYVANPEIVTDTDANGAGTLPGPEADGIGADGEPVEQAPYAVTNMRWFEDTAPYVRGGFTELLPADIAGDGSVLDAVDTLVLADVMAPEDARGRSYDEDAYVEAIRAWVERGGNLVLVDRALHLLGEMEVVPADAVEDITVYQPYANFVDLEHELTVGLRPNARQLSEATLIGYGIGNDASPMTTVATSAWEEADGHVVGTTGPGSGGSDDGTRTSVGELSLGEGRIRIMGGGLHMPAEEQDHRYGLKDYSLTYSGLFVLENAIVHDHPDLGAATPPAGGPGSGEAPGAGGGPSGAPVPVTGGGLALLGLGALGVASLARARRRR